MLAISWTPPPPPLDPGVVRDLWVVVAAVAGLAVTAALGRRAQECGFSSARPAGEAWHVAMAGFGLIAAVGGLSIVAAVLDGAVTGPMIWGLFS